MTMGGFGTPFPGVNLFAVVSMFAAVVFAPVGIILGVVALRQIRQTGERGRELAIAGILIGSGLTLLVLLMLAGAAFIVWWSLSLVPAVPA